MSEQLNPSTLPERACKFCKWCKRLGEGTRYECRYNPKGPLGFPEVKPHEWCRVYEADDHRIDAWIERKAREKEIQRALERRPS